MLNFEEISFKMISKIGEAKYSATQAFEIAKNNKFKDAYEKIKEANKLIADAGTIHMDVITEEAKGNDVKFSVLFMHAEDQFLTTQTFILQTRMMIEMMEKYEKITTK